MKKLLLFILATAIFGVAEVTDNTLRREDLTLYMRSGTWNTGNHMSTLVTIKNGKKTCAYVGSIYSEPYKDGTCPDVNVYHLVRVARDKRGLSCYYDFTTGMDYMFTVNYQQNCPDILASYNGMQFFKEVFFDEVDRHEIYYFDESTKAMIMRQSFEGDFDLYPKVQKQIEYRKKYMKTPAKDRVIRFGE